MIWASHRGSLQGSALQLPRPLQKMKYDLCAIRIARIERQTSCPHEVLLRKAGNDGKAQGTQSSKFCQGAFRQQ